jgi:osmotically-inducible protein OsmY
VLDSPELSNPNNRVELALDGDVVVLRGVVQDERERALAETLARMTPGVRGVRNELAVRETSTEGMALR